MNLDDELRAVLNHEAGMRTAPPPDVTGMISGGRSRRRRRNAVWGGGSVLAAVLAVGSVYGVAQLGETDSAGQVMNQPTSKSVPSSRAAVAIGAGTYRVPAGNGEVAPYTITLPGGWAAVHGNIFTKHPDDEPAAIELDTFVLDTVRLSDDACHGPEVFGEVQTSTAGLVAGLRAHGSGLRVSDPVTVTLAGLAAARIDLDFPSGQPRTGCRVAGGGHQIWRGAPHDYLVLYPGERASVYVVEVAGRPQLFVAEFGTEASVADRAELQSILDSIRIDG